MNREQLQASADRRQQHQAADRLLSQGKTLDQINQYLAKTPLKQVKADNLKSDGQKQPPTST